MAQAQDCIEIVLPPRCLVVLSGLPASGKSTFAQRCFRPTEAVGSDLCRAMICDDVHEQSVSREAFDLMHEIIET